MTFVLNTPHLMKIAEERFPTSLVQQMNMHRTLGIICLIMGALVTAKYLAAVKHIIASKNFNTKISESGMRPDRLMNFYL